MTNGTWRRELIAVLDLACGEAHKALTLSGADGALPTAQLLATATPEDLAAIPYLAGQPAEAAAPPRTILSLLDALKQSVNGRNGKSTAPKAGEKTPRKRARRTA